MNEIKTVVDGLMATALIFLVLGAGSAFWAAVADNYGQKPDQFRAGMRVALVNGAAGLLCVLAAIWTAVLS